MNLDTDPSEAASRAAPEKKCASALGDGYTIEVVARSEGVSIPTIRRWVREGKFPRPKKRGGERGRCVWYGETLAALRAS